jgi:hypothetical protein
MLGYAQDILAGNARPTRLSSSTPTLPSTIKGEKDKRGLFFIE